MLIGIIFFNIEIEWWGSQALWLTIILGLYLTYKVRKYKIIISYLITHIIISLILFLLFRDNILNYLLLINPFLTLYMLIEPMTSPIKTKGKIIYGIIFAILIFIFNYITPQYEPFIISLAITNLTLPIINKIKN